MAEETLEKNSVCENCTADISETNLLISYGEEVVYNMLKDHTTSTKREDGTEDTRNIYWATDSYAARGEGYSFFDPITIEKITSDNNIVIRPRSVKSKEEQTMRVKDKAEVFTPSWICNAQNNLIDEAWFGRPNVFNHQDPNDEHSWIDTEGKIEFPNTEGKTWRDYVADTRLEITCGEGPYLASRYDTVTGEFVSDVRHRIGILDRKLRVVSENAGKDEWIPWAKVALSATYGFEWQGDNLFLARESLFYTFIDHYKAKFHKEPPKVSLKGVAYIISWNLWQMDGLTFGLPGYTPVEDIDGKVKEKEAVQLSLFETEEVETEREILPHERYCRIKDFIGKINTKKSNLTTKDLHSESAPTEQFVSIVKQ